MSLPSLRSAHTLPTIVRRRATTISGSHHLGTNDSKHPFPFPTHSHPTPHEIFHLPTGASASDIKSRYYELVRYHHPDSPLARSHTPSHSHRNTRFQSILSAYNSLRYPLTHNGVVSPNWYGHGSGFDPYLTEIHRRRRTSQHSSYTKRQRQDFDTQNRQRENSEFERSAQGPKDRLVLAFGFVVLIGGLYPSLFLFPFRMEKAHQAAVGNLAKARNDAKEVGHVRREEVRKRVKDIKAAREQP